MKKILVLTFSLILMAFNFNQNIYAQEDRPKRGGTLITVLPSEPPHLNPVATGAFNIRYFTTQIQNPLLGLDGQLNVVPNLAKSWKIAEDGMTWTFNLVNNAKWHDGKPFTSADVKFTLELLSEMHPRFRLFKEGLKVETPDDFTVIVKFGEKNIAHLEMLSTVETAILPKHILGGVPKDEILKHEFGRKPIGTGAFKFKEWVKGDHITLERNENYFKPGLPYLDQIIVRFIADSNTAVRGYERGEIDYIWRDLPFESRNYLERLPNTKVTLLDLGQQVQIGFNLLHPILKNQKVRQAIAYAIDKEDIIKRCTLDTGEVAHSLISKNFSVPGPDIMVYKPDPEKAKKLLEEAGYKVKSEGFRFSIELTTRRGGDLHESMGALMRDQLAKVGIDLKLKLLDWTALVDFVYKRHQFDMYMHPEDDKLVAPMNARNKLHSATIENRVFTSNVHHYINKEVDNLFDKIYVEFDKEKRQEYYRRIDYIVSRELPQIPVCWLRWVCAVRSDFRGEHLPQRGYFTYLPLEKVWYTKGQK